QLVLEVRSHPLAVREAITQVLARGDLPAAQGLAAAYATAWSDSFLVREVARFVAWPPDRRAAKVWADSLRRAGVAAYGRAGPGAAMAIRRRALSRAVGISDTARNAAVPGNPGAGFRRARRGRRDQSREPRRARGRDRRFRARGGVVPRRLGDVARPRAMGRRRGRGARSRRARAATRRLSRRADRPAGGGGHLWANRAT